MQYTTLKTLVIVSYYIFEQLNIKTAPGHVTFGLHKPVLCKFKWNRSSSCCVVWQIGRKTLSRFYQFKKALNDITMLCFQLKPESDVPFLPQTIKRMIHNLLRCWQVFYFWSWCCTVWVVSVAPICIVSSANPATWRAPSSHSWRSLQVRKF